MGVFAHRTMTWEKCIGCQHDFPRFLLGEVKGVKWLCPACAEAHWREGYERTCTRCGATFQLNARNSRVVMCPPCDSMAQAGSYRLAIHRKRALEEGCAATLTTAEWEQTRRDFQGFCAYCRANAGEILEHFIPIRLGGGTTADNCVPACLSCNSRKRDFHPDAVPAERMPTEAIASVRAYLGTRRKEEA